MHQKRVSFYFSGNVQGVGFRYTTDHLARRFPVTGFVRNLSDGRVEVIAEGEEARLEDFLKAIRESSLADYIRNVEAEWTAADGSFKGFGVRY